MENCWFVLKQTHYPPPTLPNNGIGVTTGAICLGHIIPNPKLLDNVINTKVGLKFGPDVPIYPTTSWELRWERSKIRNVGLSAGIGLPVAAAAGAAVSATAGLAFQKSVKNFWDFESLETFIIRPTKSYIADSLEEEEVAEYLKESERLNAWSVYMITGITIARGGKGGEEESRKQDGNGGGKVNVADAAEVTLQAHAEAEDTIKISRQKITDFVWAVRLTKISKGVLDKKWSYRVLSKGATFGVKGDQGQKGVSREILSEEGLGDAVIVESDDGDGAFVLLA